MAFTVISAGDPIEATIEQVLLELKTALNEREEAFGIAQSGWNTSGHIETRTTEYVATIRAGIADLLVPHDDGEFVKIDGETSFLDEDDLLNEAGYPSGWIALAGAEISNADVLTQIQDVFNVLRKVRVIRTAKSPSSGDTQTLWTSTVSTSSEANWDSAKIPQWETALAGRYTGWACSGSYSWYIYFQNSSGYDTDALPEALGTLEYARHSYFVDAVPNGDTSGYMDVSFNGGEQTLRIEMDGSTDGVGTIDLTTFTFGIDYDPTVEPINPANEPYPFVVGKSARFYFNADGVGVADNDLPVTFLFDLESALTYG